MTIANDNSFSVEAIWDDEAKVWVSQAAIIGLHLECSSLDEFKELVSELGPELMRANLGFTGSNEEALALIKL